MLTKTEIKQKAKWTYDDYDFLPAELRCEIIDQSLYMSPSPTLGHQKVSRTLTFLLQSFLNKKKSGVMYAAPMDVVLSKFNVLQPDLIYVSKENANILSERAIKGVPDCVIEIISPGYVKYDKEKKFKLYERFGIKEYWLVEPGNELVEIFTLENKKYQLFSYAEVKGKVKSKVIKGFQPNVKEIFRKDF